MESEQEITKGQKAYLKRIVNEFKSDSEKVIQDIIDLRNKLIDGDVTTPSVMSEFKEAQEELGNIKDNILSLHDEIFEPVNIGEEPYASQLKTFVEKFKESKNEIEQIKNEIEDYSVELFGYSDEEGLEIPGLNTKIDERIKKLKELYDDNSERQENLFSEIEGLLKGASTVALAKAFKEHKDSFKTMNTVWISVFGLSIACMMIMSIVAFNSSNYQLKDTWKYTLGNIPFLAGAVWLAIYSSKQRSQNKRLQQEYAFKEDVAKIYYGLKKEVEELGPSPLGLELNQKILSVIIDVVTLNPSETLDSKSHNDKGPIIETLNSIKEAVSKNKL